MLSIQKSGKTDPKNEIVNVLPCEIAYTGKIESVERYWNPQADKTKDTNDIDVPVEVAYFRGRKLLGRTTALPKGYRGVVVGGEKQGQPQQEPQRESAFSRIARRDADESDEELLNPDNAINEDKQDDTKDKTMDEISTFDKVTVWDHETLPDARESFTRGIEEWLTFAQTIHDTDL